ncbi:DUF6705 family protein [Pedobacter sp. Du54]|uniref:DUF6705 family protein n=1 Tax=Pedobacter anseongensis TaxID=3133439 RepID=UPI0030AD95AD
MKKNLILILLTFISLYGFAQHKTNANPVQTPKIFRQPDLEKFYGTWVYEKDSQYFKIVLEKYTFNNTPATGMEFLGGNHLFKKNGKVIDEKSDSDNLNSIHSGNLIRPSKNIISFRFREYRRAVMSRGTMEYIDGPTPSILWKLNPNERRRGIILPGEENLKDPEFIVPTNITLYKVK